MLCDEFANRFVRGSIDRWGFDLDFVASVGLRRDAFALATCVYLDVDSHGVLREGDAVVLYRGGSLEFLLLVVFHGGEELVLAMDEGSATDKVVCAELAELLDFGAEVFAFALDAFDFAHGTSLCFGDDNLGFLFGRCLHLVNRALHRDDGVLNRLFDLAVVVHAFF